MQRKFGDKKSAPPKRYRIFFVEYVTNTIPTENTAICEHCGIKVKADAHFCSSCGKPVIAKPTKIFCQTCGTELEDGEMFCSKCGSSSSANKNAEALNNIAAYNESIAIQQPKKTKKKKFLNILLISLGVAVVLALLAFFVVIPEVNYRMACADLNKGNYDAAYSVFVDLGDYRDSKDMNEPFKTQFIQKNGGVNSTALTLTIIGWVVLIGIVSAI